MLKRTSERVVDVRAALLRAKKGENSSKKNENILVPTGPIDENGDVEIEDFN